MQFFSTWLSLPLQALSTVKKLRVMKGRVAQYDNPGIDRKALANLYLQLRERERGKYNGKDIIQPISRQDTDELKLVALSNQVIHRLSSSRSPLSSSKKDNAIKIE